MIGRWFEDGLPSSSFNLQIDWSLLHAIPKTGRTALAYLADIQVIYACTELTKAGEPNVIAPFIRYLEEGKEFTPILREWLVSLLKNDGSNEHYLEYGIRRGRRTSLEEFQEREAIYNRVADFQGVIVTHEFCEEFHKHSRMHGEADHYDKDTYRFGWLKHTTTGGFPDSYIDVTVTLRVGKMLNTDQIHKIVAAESGVSLSMVKRVLGVFDEASHCQE